MPTLFDGTSRTVVRDDLALAVHVQVHVRRIVHRDFCANIDLRSAVNERPIKAFEVCNFKVVASYEEFRVALNVRTYFIRLSRVHFCVRRVHYLDCECASSAHEARLVFNNRIQPSALCMHVERRILHCDLLWRHVAIHLCIVRTPQQFNLAHIDASTHQLQPIVKYYT